MADEIRKTEEVGQLSMSVNEQFAARQKALEEAQGLLQRTPNVQVDVVKPASSELDILLHSQPLTQPNAFFTPPKGYDAQYRRTFTHLPVPSIGTPEKIDILMNRVSQIPGQEDLGGKAIHNCLKVNQNLSRMTVEIYSAIGKNKKG